MVLKEGIHVFAKQSSADKFPHQSQNPLNEVNLLIFLWRCFSLMSPLVNHVSLKVSMKLTSLLPKFLPKEPLKRGMIVFPKFLYKFRNIFTLFVDVD